MKLIIDKLDEELLLNQIIVKLREETIIFNKNQIENLKSDIRQIIQDEIKIQLQKSANNLQTKK